MKRLFGFIVLMLAIQLSFGQNEYDGQIPENAGNEEFVGFSKKDRRKVDLSKMLVGGTAGFGFANGQIAFNISPTFGYQIVKDRLEVGPGIIYSYYRFKNRTTKYLENTMGGFIYTRVYVYKGIFAQARLEYKKVWATLNGQPYGELKAWNIYPGVGYSIPMGDRALMNMGLEINGIAYSANYSSYQRVISPFFNFQYRLGN